MERYLSVSEAAARLSLTPRRVRALLEEGRFPGAYKAGAFWLVPEAAVAAFTPRPPHRPRKNVA